MGRQRGVTVIPAKYRQGDDLLRMFTRAYRPIFLHLNPPGSANNVLIVFLLENFQEKESANLRKPQKKNLLVRFSQLAND